MSCPIADLPRSSILRHRSCTPDSNDGTSGTRSPSVRFSPSSTLHLYSEGPRDPAAGPSSWYSDEEMEAFTQRTREDIAALRRIRDAGLDFHHMGAAFPDVSPVGLEPHVISPEFAKRRWLAPRRVRHAVLAKQAWCGDAAVAAEVTDKAERIALASMEHSEWSVVQAGLIGIFQARSSGAGD